MRKREARGQLSIVPRLPLSFGNIVGVSHSPSCFYFVYSEEITTDWEAWVLFPLSLPQALLCPYEAIFPHSFLKMKEFKLGAPTCELTCNAEMRREARQGSCRSSSSHPEQLPPQAARWAEPCPCLSSPWD